MKATIDRYITSVSNKLPSLRRGEGVNERDSLSLCSRVLRSEAVHAVGANRRTRSGRSAASRSPRPAPFWASCSRRWWRAWSQRRPRCAARPHSAVRPAARAPRAHGAGWREVLAAARNMDTACGSRGQTAQRVRQGMVVWLCLLAKWLHAVMAFTHTFVCVEQCTAAPACFCANGEASQVHDDLSLC